MDNTEIENLEKEIQNNILHHASEIARFKKFEKIWLVLTVLLSFSNGVLGQFADIFTVPALMISYRLWILVLPCVVAINAIFDSKIEIEENKRQLNEKRNLLIQIKTERIKPVDDRIPADAFYEQMAEALEIVNRGARN
jgi:hypothetical protein